MRLNQCRQLLRLAQKETFVTPAILAETFCHDAAIKARKMGDHVLAKLAHHYAVMANKRARELGWKR